MNSLQSLSLPGLHAASTRPRATSLQDQPSGHNGWQQAFDSATHSDVSAQGTVGEASRMLALGNLAISPANSLAMSARQLSATAGDERPDGRATVGDARTLAEPASAERMDGHAGMIVDAVAAPGPDATASSAPFSAAPVPVAGAAQPRRAFAEVAVVTSSASLPRDMVAQSFAPALEAPLQQVIAKYAAAASAISFPAQRASDFSLVSRSSILPVRVHVQWRGRVADVWIGLHRDAFDQLPDIRAGVEDWVTTRGGVLGHVVCNGETLMRVTPSPSFSGAF